jgi:molybdopterin synthase sulfur carrier subunit
MPDGPPPPVVVTLPNALASLFPGCGRRVELSAATVGEMIGALDARWPGMRDRLCDPTPRLRRHINVFVEGERASLGGFRRSSQHLEGGGCDECSEAAFGRGPAGEVPFAWPAGCGEA